MWVEADELSNIGGRYNGVRFGACGCGLDVRKESIMDLAKGVGCISVSREFFGECVVEIEVF